MKDVYTALKRLARLRWRRQWYFTLLINALSLGVGVGLLVLVDKLFLLPERYCFIAMCGLGGLSFLVLMRSVFRLKAVRLSTRGVADLIEAQCPQLMDTLNTAIQVAEKPEGERSLIDRKVLEAAGEQVKGLVIRPMVIPTVLRLPYLVMILLMTVLLFGVSHFSPLGYKFRAYADDLVSGEFTGMSVWPAQLEAARGRDFPLEVELMRGEPLLEVEYLEGGEWVRYPLNSVGKNRFTFRFYDVEEDFRFRLYSPSLRSPWYEVSAYDAPEMDRFQAVIEPPAYSGYEPEVMNEPGDIEVLEGTRMEFLVQGEALKGLSIDFDGSELELVPVSDGEFRFEMRAQDSGRYRWIMQSKTGHRAQTDSYELKVIPDEAPVLEWLKPGEDVAAFPDDVVPVQLYAADDFGLKTVIVNISVSGRKQESMVLLQREEGQEPGLDEWTIPEVIDLTALGAMDGDVVSYSATAVDIREPQPRIVRSEVYFIEVRVTKEAIELDMPGGETGDTEKLDVRALVIAMKEIIRETYRAVGMSAEEQALKNQEIGTGLAMLRQTIEDIMVNAAPLLTQQGQEHLMEFLIRARDHMETAETMVNSNAPNLASSEEEQALSELVSFESELARNMMGSQGQSGEEEKPGEPPPNQVASDADGAGQQQPDKEFKDLPEALSDINQLIDRQNVLNENLGKASRRDPEDGELEALREEQQTLSLDAVELRDRIEGLLPGNPSAVAVDAAAEQMNRGIQSLAEEDVDAAALAGERARENLMTAATLLEEGINQVAGSMLEQLKQSGQQLSQAQGQAGQMSEQAAEGGLSNEERSELSERQSKVNEAVDTWLDALSETANQLRGQFPDTARELESLAEQAEEGRVDEEGTRAENALRYRRYSRAGEIQEGISEQLSELSEGVGKVKEGMSSLADSAMRSALESLSQARQELEGMRKSGESGESGAEGLQGVEQGMSQLLGQLGDMMDDDQLREMAQQLSEGQEGESWDGQLRETDAVLGEAEQLIRDRLSEMITEMQLKLMRQSSEPPEKYRSQVEKYFESLAKERPGGGR